MKVAVFSARRYDGTMLERANHTAGHQLHVFENRLDLDSALLAAGCDAVCVFVNDTVDARVIGFLSRQGTRIVATRSTGYNHIDTAAAERHGMAVVRVTDYSPHSVAEFAVGLHCPLTRENGHMKPCADRRQFASTAVGHAKSRYPYAKVGRMRPHRPGG